MAMHATVNASSDGNGGARRYRINESNLAARRELLGFGASDVKALAALAPWMWRNAKAVIADFYDRQFAAADTREFLQNYAASKGREVGWLRSHLERMVAQYLADIFEEAQHGGTYGVAYFSKRLHVGPRSATKSNATRPLRRRSAMRSEITISAGGVVEAADKLANLGKQMDSIVSQLHIPTSRMASAKLAASTPPECAAR